MVFFYAAQHDFMQKSNFFYEKHHFFVEKFGWYENMPYLCTKKKIIIWFTFLYITYVYVTNPK